MPCWGIEGRVAAYWHWGCNARIGVQAGSNTRAWVFATARTRGNPRRVWYRRSDLRTLIAFCSLLCPLLPCADPRAAGPKCSILFKVNTSSRLLLVCTSFKMSTALPLSCRPASCKS